MLYEPETHSMKENSCTTYKQNATKPCIIMPRKGKTFHLGRRALLVRLFTRPAMGSNLGELPAGERPADPLDLAGDCFCCMRPEKVLWCGEW